VLSEQFDWCVERTHSHWLYWLYRLSVEHFWTFLLSASCLKPNFWDIITINRINWIVIICEYLSGSLFMFWEPVFDVSKVSQSYIVFDFEDQLVLFGLSSRLMFTNFVQNSVLSWLLSREDSTEATIVSMIQKVLSYSNPIFSAFNRFWKRFRVEELLSSLSPQLNFHRFSLIAESVHQLFPFGESLEHSLLLLLLL